MKTLKKSLLAVFAVIVMTVIFCFGASALSSSGSCGKNVTYTYNSTTKELVISGSGAMTNYSYGGSPFYDSDIKSVVIKEGVTTIGDYAFYSCYSLQSITLTGSVTTIGERAFYFCDSLQSVTIGGGVTAIGDCAFCECYGLQSVTIPDSITTIGDSAFDWCDSLNDVYYKGTKAQWKKISIDLGNYTLTSATIHYHYNNNHNEIDMEAVGSTCTEIGYTSGKYCPDCETWLEGHDEIPAIGHTNSDSDNWCDVCDEYCLSKVKRTGFCGERVTYKWYEDDMLVISGTGEMYDYDDLDFNSPFYDRDIKSVVIKNSVTTIGDYAFYSCDSLKSVTIPDSVTTIGDDAFCGCDSLQSVTIPDSVTTISSYAFYSCDSLQSVTIGGGVTAIGDCAFCECYGLQSVTIPDSITTISSSAFYYTAYYNNENNWKNGVLYINNHLIEAKENVESVTIKQGTKTIGSYAFYDCYSLQSITIPDSVTTIGYAAFKSCESLQSVTIGNSVTTIGDDAFCDCDSLQSITIPDSVTTIGDEAFYSCDSLRSVTIGNSVTTIGDWAFGGCDSLQSVTIGNSVTTIGSYAFRDCDSLQSVTISNSVTTIDSYAFHGCDSLKSVTIGNSVTTIGSYAFYDCYSLQSVTIGNSVTTIGSGAFDSCRNLKDIYYTGTREQWKSITVEKFNDYFTKATVHYNYCGPIHKNIVDVPQQKPTCTKVGYTAGKQCSHCEEWISGHTEIPTIPHAYKPVLTKATLTANGKIESKCSCGKVQKTETIAKVSSLTLSTTKYIYDGKNKTPKLTVKDSNGKTLVKNTDYKITVASKRAGIGRYTVKVTLIGNYSGTKNLYFYILPGKSASVKSASQTVSSVKLSWSAVPGAAGYTIYRYSSSKKAYVKEGTTEGTTFTVKSLYAGKKYTFRVVAYGKTAAGKVYDSETYALLKTATKTKTPILSDTVAYKGKVKLFWTATTGETGYTVYYSTSKTSRFKKYKNYESNSGYVNNLTSGKTYYFKVRTYIKTDSGYVYSAWSNIKGVKVK